LRGASAGKKRYHKIGTALIFSMHGVLEMIFWPPDKTVYVLSGVKLRHFEMFLHDVTSNERLAG
jgi:hypothetical protein